MMDLVKEFLTWIGVVSKQQVFYISADFKLQVEFLLIFHEILRLLKLSLSLLHLLLSFAFRQALYIRLQVVR